MTEKSWNENFQLSFSKIGFLEKPQSFNFTFKFSILSDHESVIL